MNQNYDIVVVGAGLVGSSLVIALQNQGLSIAVLEKNIPMTNSASRDTRPIALAYGSRVILETLGVWKSLVDEVSPIVKVHVSEQHRFGHTLFDAQQQGVEALGYVMSFDKLHRTLLQTLMRQFQVNIIPITEIMHLQCDESRAEIKFKTTEGEQIITAKLIIAAEGSESPCRQFLNINTQVKNHDEFAFTSNIQLSTPHNNIAYERFSAQGVLAILPLVQRDQCRLVWTMSPGMKQFIDSISDQELLKQIQMSFSRRLKEMLSLQRTGIYPLKTVIADEQIRAGFALLGDAAHRIYPVAAQGFNLSLRDIAVLSEIIVDAHRAGEQIGSLAVLSRYIAWRKPDQDHIIKFTHQLVDIFGLKLPLLNRLRANGLLAIDLLPMLKRRLGRRTMGLAGKLPKLARGIQL